MNWLLGKMKDLSVIIAVAADPPQHFVGTRKPFDRQTVDWVSLKKTIIGK